MLTLYFLQICISNQNVALMQKISYILFFLVPLLLHSQNPWSLAKDDKGIQIWTRNFEDSPYKEYKVTTVVDIPLDEVIKELLDAPKYMKNCKEGVSHLVKVNKDNEHIFYARNEFPWPIKDRDVVSKVSVHQLAPNKVKLNIGAAPNEIPTIKSTLRIQELMGYWFLEEHEGTVKITQQLYINPEGSLPPFITNSLLVLGPFKTFLTLKDKLQDIDS